MTSTPTRELTPAATFPRDLARGTATAAHQVGGDDTASNGPTVGLVAVDRAAQERSPEPSARRLGQVATASGLPS